MIKIQMFCSSQTKYDQMDIILCIDHLILVVFRYGFHFKIFCVSTLSNVIMVSEMESTPSYRLQYNYKTASTVLIKGSKSYIN